MKSAKTLNFVYQWIGPNGPITNNRVPTLVDLTVASSIIEGGIPCGDLSQEPYFWQKFDENDIIISPTCLPPKGTSLYELNFSNYHYRDWKKIFSINDGPFSDQLYPNKEDIQEYINRGLYFLVTILYEGWANDKIFEAMTQFFTYHKIPLDKVIYVSNCYNGDAIYKDYCSRNGIVPKINVEYFPSFRFDKTNLDHVSEKYKNLEYQPGPRKKDFLCFQRRWSDHRVAFFLDMHRKGLLDKFFMSMDATQPESGRSYESNAHYLSNRLPDLRFTAEEIKKAEQALPLILDTSDFSKYPMESNQFDTENYFKDSLINIVSETFFFSPEIHITEKTFKPICFMQPFIMMAASGSLQHVREMGFKTFDKFWDESYDSITDNVKRYLAIVKLVEEIAAWSNEKKLEFSHAVKDIVEYNSKHFATMKHIELEQFKEKYGN